MTIWVDNKDLSVEFTPEPSIGIRYILPSMSKEEKKSVKKYPFINKTSLLVEISDKKKNRFYSYIIPKSYCYDGASVPRFFWRIIGAPTDNNFLIAAMVHDTLCENHQYVLNDRQLSSEVFNALLEVSQVGKFKRFLMKHSVNVFQRFCGWEK